MRLLRNFYLLNKINYSFFFQVNTYFFLIIVNFLTYSIYAVLSRYNFLLIEILINLNFFIFFYLYKKKPEDKISFNLKLDKFEIIFFVALLFLLIALMFHELQVPLFADEIAPTRRATRTAYFASFLFLNNLNINYIKEIPFKYVIQILSILQILFVLLIIYFIKSKKIIFLFSLLLLNFALRLIIKDAVHHPPLNHIFSSVFISFFGLSHIVVRLSYLIPFWVFLIFLFKLINNYIGKKSSMLLITSIATFPFLTIASVVPDHSLWSSLIFIFLLFYIYLKKNINYKLCILIISIGILFRISIFSGFILLGLTFILDSLNRRFIFFEKFKDLFFKENIFAIILVSLPLFLVSMFGTPAFEGIDNSNSFELFFEAIKSKIIIYSLIKQIPIWYYPFILLIFFAKRNFEIIIFFILNLVIYFSIQPFLWGNAKYVLEYGVPFFLLGHLIISKILIDNKKIIAANTIILLIIFFNICEIYQFPKSRISTDKIYDGGYSKVLKSYDKKTKYLLKIPYSYDDAFSYIKNIKAEKNTLLLGTTYGFFPEILENYNFINLNNIIKLKGDFDHIDNKSDSLSKKFLNLKENKSIKETFSNYLQFMKKNKIIRSNVKNDIADTAFIKQKKPFLDINKIENLKYILLADHGNRNEFTDSIILQNWSLEKIFKEKNYGSTLLLFKKN